MQIYFLNDDWLICLHIELTAQDCFIFGQAAFNMGGYARAVEWLEQSYILAGKENNQIVRQDQVMGFIQHTINMVYPNHLLE